MGSRACQLLATLCVASSLTLFSQCGIDPTDRVCLRTLSYCRPTTTVGPILDMAIVSGDVVGTSCEELGRHVNMGLLHPFIVPVRACHFASLVVTPRGYKIGSCPCANLLPLA
jgi:hypothetical protein